MKKILCLLLIAPLVLSGGLTAGQAGAAKPKRAAQPEPAKAAPESQALPAADVPLGAKVVRYGESDVIRIKTKLRYTTLIVLPKNEQILDFTCGDKEFWMVDGTQNLAYVKPAKAGAQTNLNLVAASGNIYSFVLAEVSSAANAEADFKVFVEAKEESMASAAEGAPRLYSAKQVDDYRRELHAAKEEARQVKEQSQAAIEAGISKHLANMRFPYRFEAGKKPFLVRAIYHDDRFTYIEARPEETPTLYETKDGKPNLVNFQ